MGGVMPKLTPRQRLIERVTTRFQVNGLGKTSYPEAVTAVADFYNGNQDSPHYALVSAESYQLIIEVIPSFASNLLAAFQQMQSMVSTLTDAAAPYLDMAARAQVEPPKSAPRYNASGLPVDEGPYPNDLDIPHYQAPPPTSEDIEPEIPGWDDDVANEVSLEDTGRRITPPPAPVDDCTHPPDQVIELTEREWHLACARRLKQLDCTYGELEQMAREGDFATSQHHMAWFSFGGNVSLEQLDRANYVLNNLFRGDAANIEMDDAAIERAEVGYPEDRITGAPDHYVINGDHSACGCGGHLLECTTWANPTNNHAASICGIARTLCRHSPRHAYRELCSDDQPDSLGIDTFRVRAGFTVESDGSVSTE